MRQRIYIFVNGILTFPGCSDNWTGKAVTATHINTPHRAEKVEYFTTALARPLHQKRRARKLVKMAQYYRDWDKVLVAHSNGADVVMDALSQFPFYVNHLFLVSPAIKVDCAKNGINAAFRSGLLGALTLFMGGKDVPLRLASLWPAQFLGYGSLGINDPVNIDHQLPLVVRKEETFGHSTWWSDEHFLDTMKMIWAEL